MSSVESGPRLPSEKSGQVAAAAMVAAAGALAPAGAYGVNAGMARARQSRARAMAGVANAPAGAKAPVPATIAAAATGPDFSDGNLGPDYGRLACCVLPCLGLAWACLCLLYTSPSPRDATLSRMPSSA